MFKAKIRQIGTSAGILIPQENLKEINVSIGDEVEIGILVKKKNLSDFGIAKDFKFPFVKDRKVKDYK